MGALTVDLAGRIPGLYDRNAAAYDRLRARKLVERGWLDRFAALLPSSGSVLDLGCGMGEPIGRNLAGRGFRITGLDTSPALIALAASRQPGQSWIVGDMRTLSLGRDFDGVVAWDSFFHLLQDDQRAMFPIFAAHTATGGALMFTSGPADSEAIGTFEGEPLYHASLAADEYRELLAASGFAVIAHLAEDPDCGGHTVWLARRI